MRAVSLKRKAARIEAGCRQRDEESAAWPGARLTHSTLVPSMLRAMRELGPASPKAIAERVAELLGVVGSARTVARIYNGRPSPVFDHNVRWAQQTAKRAGLVRSDRRGEWRLTDAGAAALPRHVGVLIFRTSLGAAYVGLAETAAELVAPGSIQAIATSTPFPLLSAMPYGTMEPGNWLPWMLETIAAWLPALADDGCLALHLGAARYRGLPALSSYRERFLLAAIDDLGLWQMPTLFWHNPSRLADLQWGAIQHVTPRENVDPIYILAKSPRPKLSTIEWRAAGARDSYSNAGAPGGRRASGREFGAQSAGGSSPPHPGALITAAQPTNDRWRKSLRSAGVEAHPCPIPPAPIEAVIRYTTEPGDLVGDFFFGSGMTGAVAERLGRRWIGVDRDERYLRAAMARPEFATA